MAMATGDECDCGRCLALCDHPGCTALAVLLDEYGEGWCQPHLDNHLDEEAERISAESDRKWHAGLSPYLYHGEEYEPARDAYWDARIDEEREGGCERMATD